MDAGMLTSSFTSSVAIVVGVESLQTNPAADPAKRFNLELHLIINKLCN